MYLLVNLLIKLPMLQGAFPRRLQLINTNVETARNVLPITYDTFRKK